MKDATILLTIGGGFLFGGLVAFVKTATKIAGWSRVEGVVTDLKKQWSHGENGGSWSFAPVVQFTVARENVSFTDGVYGPIRHKIGRRINVIYDPSNPSRASIYGWRPYALSMGFFSAAALFLAFGAMEL